MGILDPSREGFGIDPPQSGFVTLDNIEPGGAQPGDDFQLRFDFVNERTWPPPDAASAHEARGGIETVVIEFEHCKGECPMFYTQDTHPRTPR